MKIVKDQIEGFLRQSVAQGLTDREMAMLLGVGPSTVAYWREKFAISPAAKFRRTFQQTYGPDAIERFQRLVAQRATLLEIGAAFGFSREYARQVFGKLYGCSYTVYIQLRQAGAFR